MSDGLSVYREFHILAPEARFVLGRGLLKQPASSLDLLPFQIRSLFVIRTVRAYVWVQNFPPSEDPSPET